MSTKHKIFNNTLIGYANMLVTTLIGFFLVSFTIKKIGIIQYGLIGICNLFFIGGFVNFFEFGFQVGITKYIAEYYANREFERIIRLINTMLLIFIGIGLLLMVIGIALSNSLLFWFKVPADYHKSFHTILIFIFISFIIQFPMLVFNGLFEGLQKFGMTKGMTTIMFILKAIGILFLLSNNFDYFALVLLTVILTCVQFILYLILTSSILPSYKLKMPFFDKYEFNNIWSFSKFVFLNNLSSSIFYQMDGALIGFYLGPAYIASFDIVQKMPRLLKSILGINSALIPAASELSTINNTATLNKLYKVGFRFNLCLSIPLITGAIIFIRPFISLWLGEEFIYLSVFIQLFLIWPIITLMNFGSNMLTGINKKLKERTRLSYINTLVKFIILMVSISQFNILSVVMGYLLGTLITLPFYLKMNLEEFNVKFMEFFREVAAVFVIGIVPFVINIFVGYLLNSNNWFFLFIRAFCWISTYWLCLFLFVLDKENKVLIKSLLFKSKKS